MSHTNKFAAGSSIVLQSPRKRKAPFPGLEEGSVSVVAVQRFELRTLRI